MKYLVLFDYCQKKIVHGFWTRKAAVEKINQATQMADDVIMSVAEERRNRYVIIFNDGTIAKLHIVRSVDVNPLGYYHMDLCYFMTKIRNSMIACRMARQNGIRAKQRERIAKSRARTDALVMILIGLASILAGFTLAMAAMRPEATVWQFAGLGCLALIGLSMTLRGSYILINPKYRLKRTEKYVKTHKLTSR
jgi:hypothetical protein